MDVNLCKFFVVFRIFRLITNINIIVMIVDYIVEIQWEWLHILIILF